MNAGLVYICKYERPLGAESKIRRSPEEIIDIGIGA